LIARSRGGSRPAAGIVQERWKAPVGTGIRLRHPDGLIVEYVEHRPTDDDVPDPGPAPARLTHPDRDDAKQSEVGENALTVKLCVMTGVADRDAIEQLIIDGRAQQLSSREIADQIAALFDDPAWAKAIGHPLRAEILRRLRAGPVSPSRLSENLENTRLGTVAYHFRYLEKLGLVEVDKEIQRRGAVEHIYRLTTRR
jgi:helix-turn-helix protein